MAGLSTIVSGVGAGTGQGRVQSVVQKVQLTDQKPATDNVRSAALKLIMSVISSQDSAGHDLDVLA